MTLFFELIKVALGNQTALSYSPSRKEWESIYAVANKHGISGILFDGVQRLPREQKPNSNMLAEWVTLCNKLQEQNNQYEKLANYAKKTFMQHGFRSVIIKGLSLSIYHPNPTLRHSSDIDIWLEGDRQAIIDYVSSVKKPHTILYHHCDFKVIKGLGIEVHFTPSFFANPFTNKRFQNWVRMCGKRLFPICDNTNTYNIPDTDFNVIYLLTHLFRHVIDEELEIKPIIDYYFLLQHEGLSKNKKEEYMKTLRSLHLDKFAAGVMYVLKETCGMTDDNMLCTPNERHGKALLHELFTEHSRQECLKEGKAQNNHIARFIARERNLLRFLPLYPHEIIWTPYWSIKLFILIRKNK